MFFGALALIAFPEFRSGIVRSVLKAAFFTSAVIYLRALHKAKLLGATVNEIHQTRNKPVPSAFDFLANMLTFIALFL
jgi:hypothetical protein